MSHQSFEIWLLDPGALSPDQSVQLQQHLKDCPACRQTQSAWSEVQRLLVSAPVRIAPPEFTSRFQASLAERRQKTHRRQVQKLIFFFGGTALWILTLFLVRFLTNTSITELILSGVKIFTQVPQYWLDLRFIISFWAFELPDVFWIFSGAILTSWTSILLISWMITLTYIKTQGVTNR